MAYALHRRTAFRQAGIGAGWNFDLTKSSHLNDATLLSTSVSEIGGSALTPRRLFLPSDSSFLIEQDGVYTRRYNFPVNHYGDIQTLQNGQYSGYKQTQTAGHPVAYSLDGLHYVRQGHVNNNTNNFNIYSCPLDSAFDFNSIPADENLSVLVELSAYVAGLAFSADGLFLHMLDSQSIRSYYLQTPFDVASASSTYTQVSLRRFVINISAGGVSANPNCFVDWQFSPDGFSLVLLWNDNNNSHTAVFFFFKLSVPFNISTLSLDHYWSFGTNSVNGFTIDRTGQNIYIARATTVMQYALSA